MACETFTIGVPTPPPHPENRVYDGDTIGTPINNPDAQSMTVGVRLYARRAIAGGSENLVASLSDVSIGGGPLVSPVNILWTNQLNYLDTWAFTFSSRVRCSNGREVRNTNTTVFIAEV